MPPPKNKKMSLEAALDQERREILEILEGRPKEAHPSSPRPRHASPAPPPIRSMLDIPGDQSAQRHHSIAGTGVGAAGSSSKAPTSSASSVRSMLDPITPSPLRLTHSANTSPTLPKATPRRNEDTLRRSSDTASNALPQIRKKEDVDINQDYQFEMLPSIPSQAKPKRVSQGGRLRNSHQEGPQLHTSSMAAVMSGADLGPFQHYNTRGRDYGRHNSTVGIPGHSKSPSSRLGRSHSPGARLLNSNSMNLVPSPGKFVTDSGKTINMQQAYRKLTNEALSRSKGSLADLPRKSPSRERRESGESLSDSGDVRLQKDHYDEDGEEALSDDDTSEEETSSSADEDWKSEIGRGRRRSRKKSDSEAENNSGKSEQAQSVKSLLAAAEEERKSVSSSYKVKSLLDAVPSPGEKQSHKRGGVHPTTSFDYTNSVPSTPVGSEDEAEYSDIKKAQNLSIYLSPIDQSVPNRAIRTIVRGDFTTAQQEAEQGRRRLRKYMVATDLSDESVYALEWTIGTILRDGDTLYAVYAVDEETGTGREADAASSVQIGDGAKAMMDVAAVIGSQTEKTVGNPAALRSAGVPSPHASSSQLGGSTGTDSKTGSVDSRAMSKPELERLHAVEGISQTCMRLLRKTRLQVRVAVEVIHCKSPKHLITEAIDGLEPTLVILGSRGRSALKGVLLGSFSNYLVTKSSVPVMVARKKLRKHAKYKNTNIRLSNNLTTPKKLAFAKID